METNVASHPTSGLMGSVLILSSTAMGAGILAIPYVLYDTGIVIALSLLLIFAFINSFSNWVIVEAGHRTKSKSYEDMCAAAFPTIGRMGSSIMQQVNIFLGLCSYIVIIGENLSNIVQTFVYTDDLPWYLTTRFLIVCIVACIIFPLCMLRNISKLEYAASASVFIIASLAIVTIVYGTVKIIRGEIDWNNVNWWNTSFWNTVEAVTVLGGAYTCQTNIYPVWNELENNTPRRMNIVQMSQSSITFLLYVTVGFFGYIQYPVNTNSNILAAYPSKSTFFLVLRLLFSVAVIFHYPVLHYGLRMAMENSFFKNYKFNWIRHTVETLLVLSASTILAFFIKNLGTAIDLSYSVIGYSIAFTLPSICFLKSYYDEHVYCCPDNDNGVGKPFIVNDTFFRKNDKLWFCKISIILTFMLFIGSIAGTILGTYMTIQKDFLHNII
eukprot:TRINITY_DN5269_c0_g1_i2.p1 TRINITY_DN5269_c0_g1~~TRINITY_DN5269_c0_g1_i2.p1  ORF type:complete len:440 (+),score=27.57 TRINITY_DN5269_c0_g1_i2:1-1320(+)